MSVYSFKQCLGINEHHSVASHKVVLHDIVHYSSKSSSTFSAVKSSRRVVYGAARSLFISLNLGRARARNSPPHTLTFPRRLARWQPLGQSKKKAVVLRAERAAQSWPEKRPSKVLSSFHSWLAKGTGFFLACTI